MKHFILSAILFICFTSTSMHAQQVRFGANAGITMAQLRSTHNGTADNTGWRFGFCAGLLTDIVLKAPFSFQPGLNFVQKGGRSSQTVSGATYTSSAALNCLELPLNFVFRSKGAKDHFIAGIGPSLALCLWGKLKFSGNGMSSSINYKIGTSAGDDIKPLDIGANLMAGYESSSGVFITLNYNKGFSNLSNDGQTKGTTNYFSLKLGYMLKNKK